MMVAFHPPGESHAETFNGEAVASFNVEVGTDWLYQLSELSYPLDRPAEFHGGSIATLAMQLFSEFENATDATLSIETLTMEILASLSGVTSTRLNAVQPRWLTNTRSLLDAHFRDPITLCRVAREVGVHPVHFATTFRRFYGCSVGEYVRRRRLEFARERLAEPEHTLAQIALDAGFADQSHLTRAFKRFTGKTPSQYRTFLPFKTPTSSPAKVVPGRIRTC
jgi:AraC family transcriptional regulator